MIALSTRLADWLADGAILCTLAKAEGSTPREAGASLLVHATKTAGTIGGGQLEFHVIDIARQMLATGERERDLDLPLGPQMGQCCGGRVLVRLERTTATHAAALAAEEETARQTQPQVLVFGAGHTGRALVRALALLPVCVTLVDDRDNIFGDLPATVARRLLADPATALADAPAGAACVILTHSHALDYRLAEAALKRDDLAYVGLIGSATKRARFAAGFRRNGGTQVQLARLTCPIGGDALRDKRPEVIAALTAAELVMCLMPGIARRHADRQHVAA